MNTLLNLKSFMKFLERNKVYTLIDVFGFSISLMFVLLIAIYTTQELSTDQFQANKERIYIVGSEEYPGTGAAIAYKLKERYPEVEKVCPVVPAMDNMVMEVGDKKLQGSVMFADSTFFEIFSFPLVKGDPSRVLEAMNDAVISETFARTMFGTEDPVGKTFVLGDSISVLVNGVMRDMEHTALIPADVILRWQMIGHWNPSLAPDQLGNAGGTITFVLAREGADFAAKANDIREWFKTFFWIYERGIWENVRVESLSDFYFSGWDEFGMLRAGDRRFVLVLLSVGLLILIFAVINYINLTVAQAGFRMKEMAVRRLLGSSRGELFLRLMMETTLLTFVSLLIGVLLANFLAPSVNELLQVRLDMGVLLTPAWMVSMFALTLLVGAISGFLPAALISSSKPIEVVRGTFQARTKMTFSKGLIVFQNMITITLVAVSIVMVSQIVHMIQAPVGYRTKNLLVVNVETVEQQISGIENELRRLSCVSRVGRTQGLPLFGSNNWTTVHEGTNVSFQQFPMNRECFDMLGLEILRDNRLASGGWFLSEQALREMNVPEDVESVTLSGRKVPVAGIIRDFYCRGNVTTELSPVMLRIEENLPAWCLLAEINGDPFAARKEVEAAYERVTGLIAETRFMDEELEHSFDSQIRLAKVVVIFAVIAIVISLLGLLAISTYFIQQRVMEISIRKVFGSSNRQILNRLVGTFLGYVLVAFVIAVPIIFYFMRDWLSDYTYRISLSPLIFLAAGLFCLLISFVTVFFQCYRAAISNPSDNFRNKF